MPAGAWNVTELGAPSSPWQYGQKVLPLPVLCDLGLKVNLSEASLPPL